MARRDGTRPLPISAGLLRTAALLLSAAGPGALPSGVGAQAPSGENGGADRGHDAEAGQDPQSRTEMDGEADLARGTGESDPIGIDATVDLDHVPMVEPDGNEPGNEPAPIDPRFGPPPADLPPTRGEVLHAIPGVREAGHRVDVQLGRGLARVATELRFTNASRFPAEVRYRLAIPEGAAVAALEVCEDDRCRAGIPDPAYTDASASASPYDEAVRARGPADALPVAHVRPARDARGRALLVRAAPVPVDGELTVRVDYLAPAPLHGGVVRLTLPARGRDPRAAPAAVRVTADGLLAPAVQGTASRRTAAWIDPWHPIDVLAHMPVAGAPQAEVRLVRCGGVTCARARVAAGSRPAAPVDLVLLVDASPSTEGPARGRIAPALASLLALTPPGSQVRALAFASSVRSLVDEPVSPERIRLAPIVEATAADLGSATRFESAWAHAREWLAQRDRTKRPLVVIVGDGGLTRGPESDLAFAEAARRGVEVSVVNVADRRTWAVLRDHVRETGGVVVEGGGAADDALDGRSAARLEERLAALFAPIVVRRVRLKAGDFTVELGPLRAGEERVWYGAVESRRVWLRAGDAVRRGRVASRRDADAFASYVATALGRADPRTVLAAVDPRALPLTGRGLPDDAEGRCDPRGPAGRPGGVSRDDAPVALAHPRVCEPPAADPEPPDAQRGRGVPEHTVRVMLRQRIVPVARRCFRRDRAGRADYSVRAEFHFRLADREVIEASIRGDVDEALRSCLRQAVDGLNVPPFRGVVEVNYPVYTEPAPTPPRIELRPEVAEEVDAVAGEGE